MVHISHFLPTSLVFEIVNPSSWIFSAISSDKSCLISTWRQRTLEFFPPAESWLVDSNFPRASRMQGCCRDWGIWLRSRPPYPGEIRKWSFRFTLGKRNNRFPSALRLREKPCFQISSAWCRHVMWTRPMQFVGEKLLQVNMYGFN